MAPDTGDGMDAAFATGHQRRAAGCNLGGWSGTDMVARNPGGITDHLNVYTDINIGTEMTFEMLFPTKPGTGEKISNGGLRHRKPYDP